MSKLTLSVDRKVISAAKRFAKQRGVSVSKLVEAYLASVWGPPETQEMPRVLRSLRGILKKGNIRDYRRHLVEKHL